MNSWHCRWSVPRCCCFPRLSSPGFFWTSIGTALGTSRGGGCPTPAASRMQQHSQHSRELPSLLHNDFQHQFSGMKELLPQSFCFIKQRHSVSLGWTAQIKTKGKLSPPQYPTVWSCFPRGKGNKGPGTQCSITKLGRGLKESLTGLLSPKKQGVVCLSISARRQDRQRSLEGKKMQQAGAGILHITYEKQSCSICRTELSCQENMSRRTKSEFWDREELMWPCCNFLYSENSPREG